MFQINASEPTFTLTCPSIFGWCLSLLGILQITYMITGQTLLLRGNTYVSPSIKYSVDCTEHSKCIPLMHTLLAMGVNKACYSQTNYILQTYTCLGLVYPNTLPRHHPNIMKVSILWVELLMLFLCKGGNFTNIL